MLGKLALKVFRIFSGRNEVTWLGHGLQGFVFGLVGGLPHGLVFTAGAFLHRELSDFVTPVYVGTMTWRESWQKVRDDGLLDLVMPWIGAVVGVFLHIVLAAR